MQGQLRLQKYAMDAQTTQETLKQGWAGRLGTVSVDGYPYVVPVHYIYYADKIYFHCARAGHKLENIKNEQRVCFEIDEAIRTEDNPDPCEATTIYKSVIAFGKAKIVEDEATRVVVLKEIVHKYLPAHQNITFAPKALAATAIVEIAIDQMTGKANG